MVVMTALRPILFAAPDFSGLCQCQERHLLTKGNHVVFTKNVPTNKLAKRLERDSRVYLSIISKF
jgi:hypothetical protein